MADEPWFMRLAAAWRQRKARRLAPGVTVGSVLIALILLGHAHDFVRGWQAGWAECDAAREANAPGRCAAEPESQAQSEAAEPRR